MLPMISQADLGYPSEPGDYPWNGATIYVDSQHLRAWSEEPETVFNTILLTTAHETTVRLTLGTSNIS